MSDIARRSLSAVQLGMGLTTLLRPHATVAALTPRSSAMPDPRIVQVLGLRQAVQGAVGLARPTATVVTLGAAVDSLHALSLLPFVIANPRYRACALASAGLAATAAMVGVLSA